MEALRDPGSFRDPSGFVFRRDGILYRQVDRRYQSAYELLLGSGLYESLVEDQLLIPHEEVSLDLAASPGAYRVIRPEPVPFISYPYEWCFGQLKAAARLTLEIQRRALSHEMWLKDASAFNVQFIGGRPVLIDSLSFERYREGEPWLAYGQFCKHFLAPLQLMSRVDIRLGALTSRHLDGVPLDLASALLPRGSWLFPGSLLHIHLHARSIRRFSGSDTERDSAVEGRSVSRRGLEGLVESLSSAVEKLRWKPEGTEWVDYEDTHGYSREALAAKKEIVAGFLARVEPGTVWDLGANTGVFSRLAAEGERLVVAVDSDAGAVEKLYRRVEEEAATILPLWIDLANASPGAGWQGQERSSLWERGPADMALALALVHHLGISGNLPFELMAEGFGTLARALAIEFVPKEDPQAQRLLRSREDVFEGYAVDEFERAFSSVFEIEERRPLPGSDRVMYLMRQR